MFEAKTTNKNRSWLSPMLLVVLLLIALLAGGAWLWKQKQSKGEADSTGYPKYLAFAGEYVFTIPGNYTLDDQSLGGIQILRTGQSASFKDLTEAYAANAIAVQPVTELAGKQGDGFKQEIAKTFEPELKKIASDIKTTFATEDGHDVVRITVTKDGFPLRFVYIRGGQHPVQIVAKEETAVVKSIEASIVDADASEVAEEVKALRQSIGTIIELVAAGKSSELHNNQSTPTFRKSVTEASLTTALQKAKPYIEKGLLVHGAAYKAKPTAEFTAVFTSPPISEDAKPASGVLYLQQADGAWKIKGLDLPTPPASS